MDHIIRNDSDKLESVYRCLLRGFELLNHDARRTGDKCRCIVLLLSTKSRAAALLPCRDSSARKRTPEHSTPIIDFVFLDQLRVDVSGVGDDHQEQALKLFTYGRALWASRVQYHHSSAFDLVKYAAEKLKGGTDNKYFNLALFACRVGVGSIMQSVRDKLVAFNMATVISISNNGNELEAKYLPEPILAEASAWFTREDDSRRVAAVRAAKDNTHDNCIIPSHAGDSGEMAAAYALLMVMDKLRSKKEYDAVYCNMSRDVAAQEFLAAISNSSAPISCVEDYTVNFTSFFRIARYSTAAFQLAYERRVAIVCPTNNMDMDLIIVMRNNSSNSGGQALYAPIFIQVKNWANKIAKGAASVLQYHLYKPSQPLRKMFNSDLAVGVLFTVGTGGSDPGISIVKQSKQSNEQCLGITVDISSFPDCILSAPLRQAIVELARRRRTGDSEPSLRLQYGPFGMAMETEDDEAAEHLTK